MPDERKQGEARQTEQPQDGPDAGGSSQGEPGDDEGSGDANRHKHHPGDPADTNERADERASVIEPDGEPVSTGDEGES